MTQLQALPKSLFSGKRKPLWWEKIPYEELMQCQLKDIYLPLHETGLAPFVERLYQELEFKGFKKFRPHCWFSNEWFTPDGIAGIAIPFYLAHPILSQLEEQNLFEIEGGTSYWFMQLLRHECGHAIDNAYQLRRKKKRQALFGKSTTLYEDHYIPKPFSRKYVIHLDTWYAQSHPDEDFAETFALWLTPKSNWRNKYRSWPAIKKLEYMDELMHELLDRPMLVKSKRKIDWQKRLKTTLNDHYIERKKYYGIEGHTFFDLHLSKLFSKNNVYQYKASKFIKKYRKEFRKISSNWTGTYQYIIDQILDEIIYRCDVLNLNLKYNPEQSKLHFISMFSIVTLEYIRAGNHKVVR